MERAGAGEAAGHSDTEQQCPDEADSSGTGKFRTFPVFGQSFDQGR